MYSPVIGSIQVIRSGKVRRAKLYYLRDRKGKSARISEKIKKSIGADVSEKIETLGKNKQLQEPIQENLKEENETKNKTPSSKLESKKEELKTK